MLNVWQAIAIILWWAFGKHVFKLEEWQLLLALLCGLMFLV